MGFYGPRSAAVTAPVGVCLCLLWTRALLASALPLDFTVSTQHSALTHSATLRLGLHMAEVEQKGKIRK